MRKGRRSFIAWPRFGSVCGRYEGAQDVLRPCGSVNFPAETPTRKKQLTVAALPLVKLSGGAIPPSVSFFKLYRPARTDAVVTVLDPDAATAASNSFPAAQASIEAGLSGLPGAYLAKAAWNAMRAGVELSNQGALPSAAIAPLKAATGSH